jgi:ElaB/YqjD/DUF883 family membrane-anchored ribosome-binding protein
MDQASEAVQDAYGKAKDVAVAGEDYLRGFIEEQPYTSALIALGIGVAIGYIAHQSSSPPRRGFW